MTRQSPTSNRRARRHSLYADEVGQTRPVDRLKLLARRSALSLGMTSFLGRPIQFKYRGYRIPLDLAEMTGGGADTWDAISREHLRQYERYCPIAPEHNVLEVGCGVGRDAIYFAERLAPSASYAGIDIVEPSIEWCRDNITARHPNVKFLYLDLTSEMYNPSGTASAKEVVLPVASGRYERVVLHSVFTHMFRDEVQNYLREISRSMAPDARALISFFIVDDATLNAARLSDRPQTFQFERADGCYINDADHPEAAVAYTLPSIEELAQVSGLVIDQVNRGFWSGLDPDAPHGQDVVIFRKSPNA